MLGVEGKTKKESSFVQLQVTAVVSLVCDNCPSVRNMYTLPGYVLHDINVTDST